MAEKLTFPSEDAARLEPYLPPRIGAETNISITSTKAKPFVTLTFATSLDSSLSLAPGVRTRLSGPKSKAMTHYLRSRHAAILVGVSTVLADDPALNCRIEGVTSQPRPIVIDPHARWVPARSNKVFEVTRNSAGLAPFVFTARPISEIPTESKEILEEHGGRYFQLPATASEDDTHRMRFDWHSIVHELEVNDLPSVMVEGGAQVINSLLHPRYHDLVDSVIVTIAPTWLGQGGVVVSPERTVDSEGTPISAARLSSIIWHPFGEDVVLCGRLQE